MKVVILGAGTIVPATGRSPSGLYVRIGGEHVLLDAGPGTLRQLAKIGVTYLDLDRVLLTHFHPDHSLDLVSILFAMRMPGPGARRRPATICGPHGLKTLYRRLNTAFQGWITPRNYRLQLRELGETMIRSHGLTIRTRFMNHSTAAIGYRIEARGRAVAYSGDTDVCDAIVELGRGADLLILECSTTDERKVAGHLTPTECGQIAARAGCRHLVLTHFYPVFAGYDIRARVRRAFRGRLTLARDFQTFRLPT